MKNSILNLFSLNKMLFFILLLCNGLIFSQQTSRTIPNTDKFSNYGSASVGSNAGGFNYSVPLFNLSEKDINISTSLNYYSNGVSVNDIASPVGINWGLNAGGAISRTIKDFPDTAFGYIRQDGHATNLERWYKQEIDFIDDTENIFRAVNGTYSIKDTEPDWFTFNVNGISGEFFFDEDLNIHLSSDESLTLNYNEGDSIFQLIDDSGFTYFFGEEKDGEKMIENVLNFSDAYIGGDYAPINEIAYTSSWFLTRIVSPSGNTIYFNYTNSYSTHYLSFANSLSIANTCDSSSLDDMEEGELIQSIAFNLTYQSYSLSEITSSDGKIEFTYLNNDDVGHNYYVLDEVTLYSNETPIGKYKFNYEHVMSPSSHTDSLLSEEGALRERYYLLGIDKLLPISDVVQGQYFFEYYNKDLLPCRLSYNRDKYGYFNGADNTLKPFSMPADDSVVYTILNDSTIVTSATLDYFGANHDVNPSTVYYGMLSKITYPTGGYTNIEYEANTDEQDGSTIYGPGARVHSIIDVNGTDEYKREYFYNSIAHYPSNQTSLSLPIESNSWHKYEYEQVECYSTPSFDFTKYTFTDNSLLNQYNRDITPYYTAITEFKIHDGEIGGAIESKYINVTNSSPTSLHGGELIAGVPNSNDGKALYGLLDERSYYKKSSYQFDLVKRNTYQYNILDEQLFYANVFLSHYQSSHHEYEYPSINISRYANHSFVTKLVSKTTELYNPNANLITEKEISYNYYAAPYYKLLSAESNNSLGENLFTTYRYPQEIAAPTPAEQDLVDQHRISIPIETKTYLNDDLVYTKYIKYKNWGANAAGTGDLVLPEQVETAKTDALLEPNTVYHNYNEYGYPIEASKVGGTHSVTIWGYNQTKPIAKIVNATYAAISSEVANLQDLSDADDDKTMDNLGNEGALREALNNLRNDLPNAQVTTFTYDPLIGVTSVTDSKGDTQYYDYDGFNRLQFVKDSEGNILKENEYHYRTETE